MPLSDTRLDAQVAELYLHVTNKARYVRTRGTWYSDGVENRDRTPEQRALHNGFGILAWFSLTRQALFRSSSWAGRTAPTNVALYLWTHIPAAGTRRNQLRRT